jgi:hypothetical protein
METKDIAIIVLAMLVVLLIGFLLGQRRKSPIISTSDVPPLSESATHAVAPEKIDVLPPRPRPRDYSKQITQAKAFHERGAVVYAAMAENRVYSVFNDQFAKINQAYEIFNTEKHEHSREELLTLFASMLDAAKFSNVQKDISSAANEIAKSIIEYYDEQVSVIFSSQPFSNLSPRYALNADLRASQSAKISAIISGHFSNVISEMKDIDQRRNQLQSNYQSLVAATNDEFDWGSAARNFGAGALAVANPFIGIPALITNFQFQSDKGKAESAQIDRYVELFDEFENKVLAVRENIIQGAEQTKNYVAEKFKEVNASAIATILSEISANGCTLDHYFKSLDYKDLEDAERELLSEGA